MTLNSSGKSQKCKICTQRATRHYWFTDIFAEEISANSSSIQTLMTVCLKIANKYFELISWISECLKNYEGGNKL